MIGLEVNTVVSITRKILEDDHNPDRPDKSMISYFQWISKKKLKFIIFRSWTGDLY